MLGRGTGSTTMLVLCDIAESHMIQIDWIDKRRVRSLNNYIDKYIDIQ